MFSLNSFPGTRDWRANLFLTSLFILILCREHTARVMETVRSVNTGKKSSKISRKTGATHSYLSTSTPREGGAGFHFTPSPMVAASSGVGEGATNSLTGNPMAGMYRTVINQGCRQAISKTLTHFFMRLTCSAR